MGNVSYPILDRFRPWIEGELTGLSAVIYGRPSPASAPRPPKPYASIEVVSDTVLGATPWDHQTDIPAGALFRRDFSHKFQGTLRVDLYGDGTAGLARQLQLSVRKEATRLAIAPLAPIADYALAPIGPVLNVSELRDTEWDPHAQVDFRFLLALTISEATQVIDSASVNVTETTPP